MIISVIFLPFPYKSVPTAQKGRNITDFADIRPAPAFRYIIRSYLCGEASSIRAYDLLRHPKHLLPGERRIAPQQVIVHAVLLPGHMGYLAVFHIV